MDLVKQEIKQEVYCKFSIEGIHQWADCPLTEVDYLKYPHRHNFVIQAYADVSHSNRDIEFIVLQHELSNYLKDKYFSTQHNACTFGNMSCEMIAHELLDKFPYLTKIDVSEDGENGAVLTKTYV